MKTASFDVSKLKPGKYRMIVKVKETNLDKTVEKSIELRIK